MPLTSLPPRIPSLNSIHSTGIQDLGLEIPVLAKRSSFLFHDKSRASVSTSSLNSTNEQMTKSSFVSINSSSSSGTSRMSKSSSKTTQNTDTDNEIKFIATDIDQNQNEIKKINTILSPKKRVSKDKNDTNWIKDTNGVKQITGTKRTKNIEVIKEVDSVDYFYPDVEMEIGKEIGLEKAIEIEMSTESIDPDLDNDTDEDRYEEIKISRTLSTGSQTKKTKRSLSLDPGSSNSRILISEPVDKKSKKLENPEKSNILKDSKIPKRRESEGRKFSSRLESQSLTKILKRERKPSFKLIN